MRIVDEILDILADILKWYHRILKNPPPERLLRHPDLTIYYCTDFPATLCVTLSSMLEFDVRLKRMALGSPSAASFAAKAWAYPVARNHVKAFLSDGTPPMIMLFRHFLFYYGSRRLLYASFRERLEDGSMLLTHVAESFVRWLRLLKAEKATISQHYEAAIKRQLQNPKWAGFSKDMLDYLYIVIGVVNEMCGAGDQEVFEAIMLHTDFPQALCETLTTWVKDHPAYGTAISATLLAILEFKNSMNHGMGLHALKLMIKGGIVPALKESTRCPEKNGLSGFQLPATTFKAHYLYPPLIKRLRGEIRKHCGEAVIDPQPLMAEVDTNLSTWKAICAEVDDAYLAQQRIVPRLRICDNLNVSTLQLLSSTL